MLRLCRRIPAISRRHLLISISAGEAVTAISDGTIKIVVTEPLGYVGTYEVPVSAFDTVDAVNLVSVYTAVPAGAGRNSILPETAIS